MTMRWHTLRALCSHFLKNHISLRPRPLAIRYLIRLVCLIDLLARGKPYPHPLSTLTGGKTSIVRPKVNVTSLGRRLPLVRRYGSFMVTGRLLDRPLGLLIDYIFPFPLHVQPDNYSYNRLKLVGGTQILIRRYYFISTSRNFINSRNISQTQNKEF